MSSHASVSHSDAQFNEHQKTGIDAGADSPRFIICQTAEEHKFLLRAQAIYAENRGSCTPFADLVCNLVFQSDDGYARPELVESEVEQYRLNEEDAAAGALYLARSNSQWLAKLITDATADKE